MSVVFQATQSMIFCYGISSGLRQNPTLGRSAARGPGQESSRQTPPGGLESEDERSWSEQVRSERAARF